MSLILFYFIFYFILFYFILFFIFYLFIYFFLFCSFFKILKYRYFLICFDTISIFPKISIFDISLSICPPLLHNITYLASPVDLATLASLATDPYSWSRRSAKPRHIPCLLRNQFELLHQRKSWQSSHHGTC